MPKAVPNRAACPCPAALALPGHPQTTGQPGTLLPQTQPLTKPVLSDHSPDHSAVHWKILTSVEMQRPGGNSKESVRGPEGRAGLRNLFSLCVHTSFSLSFLYRVLLKGLS